MGNIHANGNQAGSFNFGAGATGLLGVNSRQPDRQLPARRRRQRERGLSAQCQVDYPRQNAWILHAGDTWRVNNRLTLDYGLRWDYYSPSSEKYDRFSFFDPVGANPGAGGRPAVWRSPATATAPPATARRYPEKDWYGGFAPRLGAVYALNDKTVIRSGWGIFYTQAFYPGWGGGIEPRRILEHAGFVKHARRHRAGHSIWIRASRRTSRSRPTSAPTTRTARASTTARSTPTSVRTRTSGTSRWIASSAQHFAERRLRRQAGRRLPSSIDPLNAIDPNYPLARQQAERRVPARG